MKAIIVREFGGPDVLKLEDVPDPQPAAGQVVVGVRAIGVNPVDTYIRSGSYGRMAQPPYTPGSDAAGEIEAVGEGVEQWNAGDRVYINARAAYAEKVACEASRVYRLPDNVSFEQGAAVGVPYATAHRALFGRANAKKGEVVLVHGASGGVGIAACQIALDAGLTVIGTAGTSDGLRLVEAQGVKYVLNHTQDGYLSDALGATCGRGMDVILEMLANVNLGRDLEILAPFGRVVVIGSRGPVEINPRETMMRDAAILGMTLFNVPDDELAQIHQALIAGLERGALRPIVGQALPLADAPRAHEAVMEGGAHGKIVLLP